MREKDKQLENHLQGVALNKKGSDLFIMGGKMLKEKTRYWGEIQVGKKKTAFNAQTRETPR